MQIAATCHTMSISVLCVLYNIYIYMIFFASPSVSLFYSPPYAANPTQSLFPLLYATSSALPPINVRCHRWSNFCPLRRSP